MSVDQKVLEALDCYARCVARFRGSVPIMNYLRVEAACHIVDNVGEEDFSAYLNYFEKRIGFYLKDEFLGEDSLDKLLDEGMAEPILMAKGLFYVQSKGFYQFDEAKKNYKKIK